MIFPGRVSFHARAYYSVNLSLSDIPTLFESYDRFTRCAFKCATAICRWSSSEKSRVSFATRRAAIIIPLQKLTEEESAYRGVRGHRRLTRIVNMYKGAVACSAVGLIVSFETGWTKAGLSPDIIPTLTEISRFSQIGVLSRVRQTRYHTGAERAAAEIHGGCVVPLVVVRVVALDVRDCTRS